MGCGGAARVTAVQVRRIARLREPEPWPALRVRRHDATAARRLFQDMCVIEAHRTSLPSGPINCPADWGVSYDGAFYAGGQRVAAFSYAPSGCASLLLITGGHRESTAFSGAALRAEPRSFSADFARVLGISPAKAFGPPS